MLRKRERILLASLALSILILVPTVLNREHRSAEGYKGDYILADVLDTLARLHLVYDREVARRQLLDSLRADLEYFEMVRMPSELPSLGWGFSGSSLLGLTLKPVQFLLQG